jgi:hypothetical protein
MNPLAWYVVCALVALISAIFGYLFGRDHL